MNAAVLLLLLLPLALPLGGCGDLLGGAGIATLDILPVDTTIGVGDTLRLRVVARDGDGRLLNDANVRWSSANEAIIGVAANGLVTGVAAGGPVLVTARSGGQAAVAQVSVRSARVVSPLVAAMFARLGEEIAAALRQNQDNLPRNPQNASWINAKIALLQRPALATEIIAGGFFAEDSVRSTDGRSIGVASVYPLPALRAEAGDVVHHVANAVELLETFMRSPFPAANVRIWQGFVVGASGGGGGLWIEDRATYDVRTAGSSAIAYEQILTHETAHSYVGNESLTQFLELYLQNVLRVGSPDIARWTWTRGYTPQLAGNTGVHALLDVYQLLGPEAMSRAYAALYPLRPRYGEPLSPAVRQAFVDAAPAALQAQVAAKLAAVQY